jgi:hypothetical protein
VIDLDALDARVARASASLQRGGDDPLGSFRDVSGKNAYDALKGYDPGPIQAPHRDGLLRWIAFFTEARVGWELVLEEAKREKAEDPRLIEARKEVAIAKTWEEARAALLMAPNVVERGKALARLGELADPIVAVRRERRMRNVEVAHRLGVAPEPPTPLAAAVLDATEPLARDWRKKIGATAAQAIESSFAKDATEGWPARLTSRWLEDAFKTIAPRTPRDVAMPAALGGASFLRAATNWGYALRLGSTAKSLPFALARDPHPSDAFLYGDLLALAVSSRVFQRRKLDLAARVAEGQERMLARTRFIALRTLAALAIDDDAEARSARAFGEPLPRALGEAWAHGGFSGRLRSDAGLRLVAMLRAYALADELVAGHDDDWFDNPRAAQRLGHIAAGPVRQDVTLDSGRRGSAEGGTRDDAPPADIATKLARAFEEAIG